MKRNELIAGETYAYRAGKYGSFDKVRVIDTEAVHRISRGFGYSGTSDKKDGMRVVFVDARDTYGGWSHGHCYVTEDNYQTALKALPGHSPARTIGLYDGVTVDGEQILRIMPRYIAQTWAEHEAKEAQDVIATTIRIAAKKVRIQERREAFEKLPEEYKEFIKLDWNEEDFDSMDSRMVERFVKHLTERRDT